MSWRRRGYVSLEELRSGGFLPPMDRVLRGPVAVTECVEEIPCNVCTVACNFAAISTEGVKGRPRIDWNRCAGCGMCVGVCPGQAMFVVSLAGGEGRVTLPYEFLPKLRPGARVRLLSREGRRVGEGIVERVFEVNKTQVVTVKVPPELVWEVRAVWPE